MADLQCLWLHTVVLATKNKILKYTIGLTNFQTGRAQKLPVWWWLILWQNYVIHFLSQRWRSYAVRSVLGDMINF